MILEYTLLLRGSLCFIHVQSLQQENTMLRQVVKNMRMKDK